MAHKLKYVVGISKDNISKPIPKPVPKPDQGSSVPSTPTY